MSKLTKAQLIDENIRAREHAAHLEARLVNAAAAFRAQRDEIAALRAQLAAAGAQPAPRARRAETEAVVTQFTDRFGRVWEKTRVGNRATSRLVEDAAA